MSGSETPSQNQNNWRIHIHNSTIRNSTGSREGSRRRFYRDGTRLVFGPLNTRSLYDHESLRILMQGIAISKPRQGLISPMGDSLVSSHLEAESRFLTTSSS